MIITFCLTLHNFRHIGWFHILSDSQISITIRSALIFHMGKKRIFSGKCIYLSNFEKNYLEYMNLSFNFLFKTSCAVPPYYSSRGMLYELLYHCLIFIYFYYVFGRYFSSYGPTRCIATWSSFFASHMPTSDRSAGSTSHQTAKWVSPSDSPWFSTHWKNTDFVRRSDLIYLEFFMKIYIESTYCSFNFLFKNSCA